MSDSSTNTNSSIYDLNQLVDKVERLTSASYMVTNYLNDKEPLKWKLRTTSLDLLNEIKDVTVEEVNLASYKNVFYKNLSNPQLVKKINEITSLLTVGISAGNFSTMNFSLLKGEYEKLADYLVRVGTEQMQKFTLTGFSYPALATKTDLPLPVKPANPTVNQMSFNATSYRDVPVKKDAIGQARPKTGAVMVKSNRQEEITSFLKDRGWVSITEITQAVRGVSSKTIQRELALMVNKGQLRKKGDRRWSRYILS